MSCFRFVAAEKAHYPVSLLCRMLGVSRAGFYGWERRPPSDRQLADVWLVERIREIHAESRQTYGARRVHRALRHRDVRVGRKRVERLMRREQLSGLVPKRFRRTTIRVPGVRVADDLVERDFVPAGPNRLWCADIKYVRTWQGWLYLAAVMDCYSRRIVGWSMRPDLQAELVVDALEMAITRRQPKPGLVHRSDQGSQYVSLRLGERCREIGIQRSMGSRGDCFDNAVAESFFRASISLFACPRARTYVRASVSRVRWWDMQLANRALDLAVKIAAILAAVAAINLLGAKPHLVATPTCHVSIDAPTIADRYRAVGKLTPSWLAEAVQEFDKTGKADSSTTFATAGGPALRIHGAGPLGTVRIPSGVQMSIAASPAFDQPSTCAPVRFSATPAAFAALIRISKPFPQLVPPGTTLKQEASSYLSRASGLLGPSLARFLIRNTQNGSLAFLTTGPQTYLRVRAPGGRIDEVARSALTAATTITTNVNVENRGHGGATNVRVEPPLPYISSDQPAFDLAPNETRTVRFSIPAAEVESAPTRPLFQPLATSSEASTQLS